MIGYTNHEKDIAIGIGYMPQRRKPCLVVKQGNQEIKHASFNDGYSAVKFMDMLAEVFNLPKIDWLGDDIPWGLRPDLNNWEGGGTDD